MAFGGWSVTASHRWQSRPLALIEILAMTAWLLSYIWVWKGAFAGHVIALVAGYFGIGVWSHWHRGETLEAIGFRRDNVGAAVVGALPVVVSMVIPLIAVGIGFRSLRFPSIGQVPGLLLWRWVWSTAQQYGLLCFLLPALERGARR
jgi:hypothetical protein